MKRIPLLIFLLTSVLSAQISVTRTTSSKKHDSKKIISSAYDSTYNFPSYKIKFLIGQKFYVKPKAEKLRKFGYLHFIKDPNKSEFAPPNIYCHNIGIASEHDSLANRYFEFKDIVWTKSKKKALLLIDTNAKDTLYYVYDAFKPETFPFLIEGYFKKIVNKKVGKRYILRQLNKPLIYVTQGFEAIPGEEKFWTIEQVTLDDKNFDISYILSDDDGHKILVNKDDFEKTALTEKDYKIIKIRYPKRYKIILNKNVITGMSKEACKFSLGVPQKVNYSGDLEQWLYKNITLYFNKGILTSYTN